MEIVQSFITNNDNYHANKPLKVKGLMIHSVGTPQPSAKVFVNSFNVARPNGLQVGVHGFMGEDGILYQTLPWDMKAWHCGSGTNGSGNDTHIGIEITEPNTIKYTQGSQFVDNDPARTLEFVQNTYRYAVKHFADLCRKFDLSPLADGVIISHSEGHKRGIASNHGDIEHVWGRYGQTMNQFRKDIAREMEQGVSNASEPAKTTLIDILGDVKAVEGEIVNGKTMVWLVDIADALGFVASWDGDRRLPVVSKV